MARSDSIPSSRTLIEALELDRSNADHRLVATALGAQRGGADVILVTHDVTPRIAGNLVGIRAVDMPSAFLLPASEDPQAQEIRRLKADLEQERSRRPVLAVGVEGSQQVEIEWARQPLHIPRQVMDGVRSIQAETYPKPSRLYRNTDPALIPPDAQHLERGIAQHSRQVQDWLNTLNDYLRETSHLYLLAVELRNEGSAPATDVTLELSFPEGVEPSTRAVVPDPPPPPRPQFSSN